MTTEDLGKTPIEFFVYNIRQRIPKLSFSEIVDTANYVRNALYWEYKFHSKFSKDVKLLQSLERELFDAMVNRYEK